MTNSPSEQRNGSTEQRSGSGAVGRRLVVGSVAAAAGAGAIVAAGGGAWAAPAIRGVLGAPSAAASGAGTFAVRLTFVGEATTPPGANGVSAVVPAEIRVESVGTEAVPAGGRIAVSAFPTSRFGENAGVNFVPAAMVTSSTRTSGAPGGLIEIGADGAYAAAAFELVAPLASGDALHIPLTLDVGAGRVNPWDAQIEPHDDDGSSQISKTTMRTSFSTTATGDATAAGNAVATRDYAFSSVATPICDLDLEFVGEKNHVMWDDSVMRGPAKLVIRNAAGVTGPFPRGMAVHLSGPFTFANGVDDPDYGANAPQDYIGAIAPGTSLEFAISGADPRTTTFTAKLVKYDIAQTGDHAVTTEGVPVTP